MTIEIPLSENGTKHAGKYVAIVDDCDADLAEQSWQYWGTGYATIRGRIFLHRVIMARMQDGKPLEVGQFVDHKDRNKLNNTRENLRLATKSQNGANRGMFPHNTSGYKGVHWKKSSNKWYASIRANGRQIFLGYFATKKEALQARNDAEVLYFKEFACIQEYQGD